MELKESLFKTLTEHGVGRRKLDDPLFIHDKPPRRLGVYDVDDENLCHDVVKLSCHIPGCLFTAESLLEFENHYNGAHRYTCSQCKKVLPSPHLLDLHIQEIHDSFFAVMAAKKPSYCCYIEDCKEKFTNADERLNHCVKIHKLPKDFRFDQRPKIKMRPKTKPTNSMEVDNQNSEKKISFNTGRQKSFNKYTGKNLTEIKKPETASDVTMRELKDNMPQ